MTNEEILAAFLKHYKIYLQYKRLVKYTEVIHVRSALIPAFSSTKSVEEANKWTLYNKKWLTLCNTFNITGYINTSRI